MLLHVSTYIHIISWTIVLLFIDVMNDRIETCLSENTILSYDVFQFYLLQSITSFNLWIKS